MGGLLIFIVLAVVAGLIAASWVSVPKGENQVVIRTCAVLTFICCYLMWAIVYLAQLHPLIQPRRSNLRAEP